jgi:tetratricopeptide (TPR) repeat protein
MAYVIVEELKRGFELLNEGKVEEALQFVTIFERKEELAPEERLKSQIFKGILFYHLGRFGDAFRIGELAYQESLRLEKPLLSIDAIFLEFKIVNSTGGKRIAGKWVEYGQILFQSVKNIEKILKSSLKEDSSEIEQREAFLNYIRGYLYSNNGELDHALKSLQKSLEILERYNQWFYLLPHNLLRIGLVYSGKGELELALQFYRRSLEVSKGNNVETKGFKACTIREIGKIYFQQGELDQALKFYEKSLKIFEKIDTTHSRYNACSAYYSLIFFLAKDYLDLAQQYLSRFQEYLGSKNISENNYNYIFYELGKVRILTSSSRTRDRAEAEKNLKKFIEKHDVIKTKLWYGTELIDPLILLCDLYLEELRITHNMEIINDIQPYLTRLLKESERINSYSLQAQAHLFQGQIALLQMNLGDARRYLTNAQQIADNHGLQLLARSISREHDKLLEQLDEWEDYKRQKAPLSEIMKLVSLNETIERMQGKQVLKKKELMKEDPMLLLVMNEGGVLLFSYPFTDEWKRDNELLGSFMSAFTSFSDEFFSEELDRIKFGQYTVLMKPIPNFSICYVFKGQSYLAKQKLTHFTKRIQNNSIITQTLNKFNQTSQVIEIKDFPFLEAFITEIFTSTDQLAENF